MIDFRNPAFNDDPYPTYRFLLDAAEPLWIAHEQPTDTGGVWLFSRYDDVSQILKMPGFLSKNISRVRRPGATSFLDYAMLNVDPPDHTRLRKLVAFAFSSKRVMKLEPVITRIVDDLIKTMQTSGHADFIADFAESVPIFVISEILGLPREDRDLLRSLSIQIRQGFDSVRSDPNAIRQQSEAMKDLGDYLSRFVEMRNRCPRDDLISELSKACYKHNELTSSELLGMCLFLLFAGHETTVNLLGNGLLALFRNPDQLKILRHHPACLPSAIEEMLRFESPLQRSTFRITTDSCRLGGKELRGGEQVGAIIGAANRDPRVFDKPDCFDVTRKPNRHLAFGEGIHVCLGATLARKEAKISFSRVFERLPKIQLDTDTIIWNSSTFFRGLSCLPIRF